jgi:hypothetical protein
MGSYYALYFNGVSTSFRFASYLRPGEPSAYTAYSRVLTTTSLTTNIVDLHLALAAKAGGQYAAYAATAVGRFAGPVSVGLSVVNDVSGIANGIVTSNSERFYSSGYSLGFGLLLGGLFAPGGPAFEAVGFAVGSHLGGSLKSNLLASHGPDALSRNCR